MTDITSTGCGRSHPTMTDFLLVHANFEAANGADEIRRLRKLARDENAPVNLESRSLEVAFYTLKKKRGRTNPRVPDTSLAAAEASGGAHASLAKADPARRLEAFKTRVEARDIAKRKAEEFLAREANLNAPNVHAEILRLMELAHGSNSDIRGELLRTAYLDMRELEKFKKRQGAELAIARAEADNANPASPARQPPSKPVESLEERGERQRAAFGKLRDLIGFGGDKGKVVVPSILRDMVERLEGFTGLFEIFVEEVLEVQRRQGEEVAHLREEISRLKASSGEAERPRPEPDSTSSP